uniref:Uncharacterized protein n=1 Tax=Romanomermis culicivorax TaxID=13658 RepID=A0A915J3R2_ROMCU
MNLGPSDEQILSAVQNGRIRPLILDLYAFTDGYKVTIPGKNCVDSVTQPFKYERDYQFLEFIQYGELPYILTDLFERFCPGKLFYYGCMVVHIRKHWLLANGSKIILEKQ